MTKHLGIPGTDSDTPKKTCKGCMFAKPVIFSSFAECCNRDDDHFGHILSLKHGCYASDAGVVTDGLRSRTRKALEEAMAR